MRLESFPFRVEMLGRFQLTVHGSPVTNWRAGRARQLLQYLLVNRGRVVPRDELREAVWGHLPATAGTTSLKAAVHGLRRVLDDPAGTAEQPGVTARPGDESLSGDAARSEGDGRPGEAGRVRIRFVNGGYRLCEEGGALWVDVDEFDRAMAAALAAERSGDRDAAVAGYRDVVAAYRGPFLPDQETEWAVMQRERIRTRVLRAYRYLGETAWASADDWTVVDWCHQALEVDPYDERAFELLVGSSRRLGLPAQAERIGELARVRLADD